ncbi:MAG: hypothetical protein LUG23_02430 [Oscillospiraceae bacterium]|nr:hypothetical protein [Oscillospiraceae bacterium]
MSLVEIFSEEFSKLTVTGDGFTEGETFTGALILDSSSEEDSKLVRKYTLTVSPDVDLSYGDVFKRVSDGSAFQITGEDTGESPDMATFSFRQFSAEDYDDSTTVSGSLTITDGTSTVILPLGTDYTIQKKRIGSTATASDGTTVLDVIGSKITFSVGDIKLSKATLEVLISMIEASPFLSVTYPDALGSVTADFLFDIPKIKACEFDDEGVSEWYAVDITATGKEVE